jgi:uncharacterized protein YukE
MLTDGGGGYGAITGNSFTIKTEAVAAASASGYTAAEIEQLFSYLDPSAVAEAGAAHNKAASTLSKIADQLVTHVQKLQANWSGSAAEASLSSFQQLHQSAVSLAQAATQTGAALTWLGTEILPSYKNYRAPSNGLVGDVESLFGDNPQNTAAQAKMEELNDRLVQANGGLPASVTVSLPHMGSQAQTGVTTGGIAPGGGAGAAARGVGLAGGAAGGVGLASGGSGGISGVTAGGSGATGGVGGGGGGLGGVSPSPTGPTHLAGLPSGGGTGSGAGTGTGGGIGGSGGVPGGSPGGTVGGGGPDPAGLVPMPGGGNSGGGEPGDGDAGDLGGLGDGTDPAGIGTDPAGIGTDPAGIGTDPAGIGAEPLPVGSVGTDPFGAGSAGGTGSGIGGSGAGEGLIGEDMAGGLPGDSAVIGPDGMIGAGPGGPDAGGLDAGGLDAGFADSGAAAGNTGATGFVGADGAAAGTDGAMADTASGAGDAGFPMMGGSAGGRQEAERRRQSWMAEDADIWEGESKQVPPLISA